MCTRMIHIFDDVIWLEPQPHHHIPVPPLSWRAQAYFCSDVSISLCSSSEKTCTCVAAESPFAPGGGPDMQQQQDQCIRNLHADVSSASAVTPRGS